MSKKSKIIFILFIFILGGLFFIGNQPLFREMENYKSETTQTVEQNPKKQILLETSEPLYIDGFQQLNDTCTEGNGTIDDPFVISNLVINGNDVSSPIHIENTVAHLIIKNCTLFNSPYDSHGLYLCNVSNIQIINNTIRDNGACGIFTTRSSATSENITIENNMIVNNYYIGIRYLSQIGIISSNYIADNNDDGISLGILNADCLIKNNFIINNNGNGISTGSGSNCTIHNNTIISNRNGIEISYSTDMIITANIVSSNEISNGINLKGSNNIVISENQVHDNLLCGIELEESSKDNFVLNNEISGNGQQGIVLWSCSDNQIVGNKITANNYYGIYLFTSTSNVIERNFVKNNDEAGIVLGYNANYNDIIGNVIDSNKNIGFYLYQSSNNMITRNRITKNILNVLCWDSSNNDFFLNLFFNPSRQVDTEGTNSNNFDNGTYGNYWSDYTSRYPAATNDASVWNTPYEVAYGEDNPDGKPLVVTPIASWDETPPSEIRIQLGTAINFTLNASSMEGIETWSINNTSNTISFGIDATGRITSLIDLEIGTYYLIVQAIDGLEYYCSATITIIVEDTINPTWIIAPEDQTLQENEVLSFTVSAQDSSGIDHWWISDTINFNINENGVVTNNTILTPGTYSLEIRAYDPYDNYCTTTITIIIQEDTSGTDPSGNGDTSGIAGYATPMLLIFGSIAIVILLGRFRKLYLSIS